MSLKIKAVVLAAGKGKRLRASEDDRMPKVMKLACGKPLLDYVLSAISFIPREDTVVIVGFGREQVLGHLDPAYGVAEQRQQLGTAHAVASAKDALAGFDGGVLVCAGDMPLVRRETYERLTALHRAERNDCTILTARSRAPKGYGRILRGADGGFLDIVEEADCTPEQRALDEINSSIYVFDSKKLFASLARVENRNAQGEFYLTDVPLILKREGGRVGLCALPDDDELIGVNTVQQLEEVERRLSLR